MMRSAARVALTGAALLACAGAPADESAGALDPSPQACARCHAEIAAQWSASMHARAWDDPIFRAEYDPRPLQSCRDCHAPATSAPGRSAGIDCATCHVRDGAVLASAVTEEGMRAHPVRLEPRLRAPEHCGDCHQFQFTDDGAHDPAEALQNTLVEHRDSAAWARGEGCRDCHMPAVIGADGRRFASHAFPGIHDPEQLARAVDVEVRARRTGERIAVDVRLAGADIGHAFPTGDVFRSAVLRVTTPGGAADALVMERSLARTIDPDGQGLHVRTVDDSRVPPPGRGELRERLELVDDGAPSIAWELVLHRLPPARAARAGIAPETARRLVARGVAAVER